MIAGIVIAVHEYWAQIKLYSISLVYFIFIWSADKETIANSNFSKAEIMKSPQLRSVWVTSKTIHEPKGLHFPKCRLRLRCSHLDSIVCDWPISNWVMILWMKYSATSHTSRAVIILIGSRRFSNQHMRERRQPNFPAKYLTSWTPFSEALCAYCGL